MLPFLAALAPFAPLIGGAIGAVGSLLAPKPKPTTQTNSIDLMKLRSDAEAAGFNPLTIIRGGGLAGYGTSTMSAAPDMRLSNAFSTFGSGFAQWQYDPYGEQKSLAELSLAKAQIASYAKTSAPSGLSFGVPSSKGVQSTGSDGMVFWGNNWGFDPNTSPAQLAEDRYGDIMQAIYGLGVFAADAGKNIGFKGDKLVNDLGNAARGFAGYLDARRTKVLSQRDMSFLTAGVTGDTSGFFE